MATNTDFRVISLGTRFNSEKISTFTLEGKVSNPFIYKIMSFYTLNFAASVEDANIHNSQNFRKQKRQEKRAELFLSQRKSQRCATVNFNKEVRSVFETKLSYYHFDLILPKKVFLRGKWAFA